jgi:orotidine-5'-phosphate decarboxylase
MTRQDIFEQIMKKQSYLCIGLDTDINKIPAELRRSDDPIYEFNKRIVDATLDLCISYKLNLAFYESLGSQGLISLKKTIDYIPKDIFLIADAKRGDIGNTSSMYARAYFEHYCFDGITLSPYMGKDSIDPYLKYPAKWVILLALTSNKGSTDFQLLKTENGFLYEEVLRKSNLWGSPDQIMYVVGATKSSYISDVREIVSDNFLLIPGIGAQGGDLAAVTRLGINKTVGLIVNASRSILFASNESDFDKEARKQARKIQSEMKIFLDKYYCF